MRNLQLRTKFLLLLLAVSAGLTTATLAIVRQRVRSQVGEAIGDDLRNSVNAYNIFEKQRQVAATQSARLIANLPYLRALMTTRDKATIQDGSLGIWKLCGSDLLFLADRSGQIVALHANSGNITPAETQPQIRAALEQERSADWWLESGRLFEVWIQPIYFGEASENAITGYLAVGYEINDRRAQDFRNVSSSEIVFQTGGQIIAGTLGAADRMKLRNANAAGSLPASAAPRELDFGGERFLMTTIRLSPGGELPVSMSVLKSLDKAYVFLSDLNRVLLAIGLFSVLIGSALVYLISKSFLRPLANLVGGVRALGTGDFAYPLETAGGDEVAEVTRTFVGMRDSLQNAQKEQQLLEQRLRQAHKMEAIGRLAGGVAHDFNNLLTIIRGHSDLLLDRGTANAPERNNLEQIKKAADRAVGMTRQLLAFSRMQVLQPRVIDLNSVVAEMGKMLPRLIGEHIEYVFLPEPRLPRVKADPGQVEQVVMNLAVNARDAMPGGGKLTVQIRIVDLNEAEARRRPPMSPGHYVLLSVADTGTGMDEKTKAHIFEPFFTTKEVGKGTGLGLATVYGVVKQSGGFIWVESAPGQGTTFEIYLPVVSDAVPAKEREAGSAPLPRGSETVLVVEDEEGVRELAAEFLRSNGYSVLEARDGVEAMEISGRFAGTIHVILTDMVMPRMSGTELVKNMKTVRPAAKAILMSGYSEQFKAQQDGSPDQFSVLQKPFSLNSLVEAVRAVLAAEPAAEEVGPRSSSSFN
ncbi:MAG TPA: ATP-binding protein [Candidatus Acidoferrum sp.]|nr:ATP-binding protein [Candidatus Acidoferrum sp.]